MTADEKIRRSLFSSDLLPLSYLLLAACAPSRGAAYDRAFAQAARAESAGRFAEAARGYDDAATAAVRPRDRDQARWDAAESLAHAGNIAEAAARYSAMAFDPSSEHRAEAAYRAALAGIEHGDPDRGWQEMEQVPRRFPSHGVAHVAVRRLVGHADEEGPSAALAELRSLERDLASTELEELVAFLAAQHLETSGVAEVAREAYSRIADRWPYPFGAFWDDALWHASLLDEKLGRYPAAVDDLERMVRERETTFLVGSYERPLYVALYRDRLGDHARARDAFHRLYADFTHSTKRDDALWLEASLWREDGDAQTACSRLATLVRDFPSSRYVPCAARECAGITPGEGGKAPSECHAYLMRSPSTPLVP